MILFYVFVGLLLATVLFAWWRGGGPERATAAMFVIAWLLTLLTRLPIAQRHYTVAYHTLAIDLLLFVGLLALSRRANRIWPVVAASLQALIVLAHIARAINPYQIRIAYVVMTGSWPIIQLLILNLGTVLHWRRMATKGADDSWRR